MYRVLHVVGSLGIGGTELLLMQYMRYPKLDNYFIIFNEFSHKNNLINNVEKNKILTIDKVRIGNIVTNYYRIKKFIELHDIKILHTHVKWSSGFYVVYAWIIGLERRIVHAHSANAKKGFIQYVYQTLMRLCITFFGTHLIANSSSSGSKLFGKAKYIYLPNFIDPEPWLCESPQRDGFGLIYAGRLSSVKNIGFLLKVLVNLPKRFTLMIVGDGPERNNLEKLSRELGLCDRVEFKGFQSDIKSHLLTTKIFVSPSLSEGLGISLIEAQLTGALCVVSEGYPSEAIFVEENVSRLALNVDLWTESILEASKIQKVVSKEKIIKKYFEVGYSRERQLNMIYNIYG